MTSLALRSMPSFDEIQFAPDVVYVVILREVWIQHNTKILKLIDSWQDSVPCPDCKTIN